MPKNDNHNMDFERELANIKRQLAQCKRYAIQHEIHPFVRVRPPRSNAKKTNIQLNKPAEHD